ncbi:uncharacterized protein LOC131200245 [Ahaetulla prasina]|uniref:uncharacterized protein LOC131200245 n=1 Tax=Ahaetulla prasina TaxID=499056 RepID=UPI00264A3F88|nr:uncharacterized protein LOC131200245 [Ahaetulla prasina]
MAIQVLGNGLTFTMVVSCSHVITICDLSAGSFNKQSQLGKPDSLNDHVIHLTTAVKMIAREKVLCMFQLVGNPSGICRATLPIQPSRPKDCREWRPVSQQPLQRKREQNGHHKKSANSNQITIRSTNTKPEEQTYTMVTVDGQRIKMEIDTGSPITIVSWSMVQELLPQIKRNHLQTQYLQVRDFQGNRVPVDGIATVNVVYGQHKKKLPVTIVQGNLPSLMGWDWIHPLGIGLYGVLEIQADCQYMKDDLLHEFQDVFAGTLGN